MMRAITFTVLNLIFNLLYAFYNGAIGLVTHSAWFIISCLYYLLLSAMRFSAVVSFQRKCVEKEYSYLRLTGILLCLLSVVLSGILFLSLSKDTASKYGEITMITIATYTFIKIIVAIVKSAKQNKDNSPLLKAIRYIRYTEIAVSVFTMQQSMLVSFQEMSRSKINIFNSFTGTAVCLFTLTIGVMAITGSFKKGVMQ